MPGDGTGTNATAALPPEVQEKLTRLEKLEKDNAGLGYRLRAWEKLGKEAGNVIRYDEQGIPMGFDVTDPTAGSAGATTAQLAQVVNGAHPLAPLSGYIDNWNPSQVDTYYQQLVSKQGYLTKQQWEERENLLRAEMLGNIHLFRTLDRTLAQKDYAELANYGSPWAKRTAEVLQENSWARPLEGATSWDQWQYASPAVFKTASDIAMARMHKEQQAAAAETTQTQPMQAAANLSVGTTGAASVSAPDMEKLAAENPEEFNRRLAEDVERNAKQAGVIR